MLKKFKRRVLPGVELTLATFPLVKALMKEDFPAFDRPAMATSANLLTG